MKTIGDSDVKGMIQAGLDSITISSDTGLTADQCRGSICWITGAYRVTLPAVSGVVESGHVTLYATTAAIFKADPNASDRIRLNGTALDDGDRIDSEGNAGNHITLVKDGVAGWTNLGRDGTFTDGGQS